jgi:hypothetical protein
VTLTPPTARLPAPTRTPLRGAVALLGIAALLGVSLLPAGLAAARADWPDAPSTTDALVAAAHASAPTDADRAGLLAAEAYRLDPSARTHGALLAAVDTTAWLEREVTLADDVTAMTSITSTGEVLAATAGGDVVRWDLDSAPERVGAVGGWITELVSDTTGATVAALDSEGTARLLTGDGARTAATSALDIAVSPNGLLFAALIDDEAGRRLEVRDVGTEAVVAELEPDDTAYDDTRYDSVHLGDDFVVLSALDSRLGEQGRWERRSLPGLSLVHQGSALPDSTYDADLAAVATLSQYGHLAATVHPVLTTVQDTSDGTSLTSPGTGAPLTIDVRAVVFSPEFTKYLAVRDQKNYLFATKDGGFWELQGAVAADAAAFADENRVVTAQGRVLTEWDVGAQLPLAQIRQTEHRPLERQAFSPDGRYLLAVGDEPGDDGANVAITYDLRVPGAAPDAEVPGWFGAVADRHGAKDTWLPVVTDDGTARVVETADGTVREAGAKAPAKDVQDDLAELSTEEFQAIYSPTIRYETGLRDVLGARITSDGELVLAAADGAVRVLDPATGDLRRAATPPGGPWTSAEIAPDGRHVAFSAGATVAVVDTTTAATTVQLLGITDADLVLAFGADELVVAHPGGVVVLEADGSAIRAWADAPMPAGLRSGTVLPGTGIAVLSGDSPLAVMVDLATGAQLGDLNTGSQESYLGSWAGRLLAVGSDAGNRRVVSRDLRPESLLTEACTSAGRDLSVEEWSQVVDTPPPSDLSCTRAP